VGGYSVQKLLLHFYSLPGPDIPDFTHRKD